MSIEGKLGELGERIHGLEGRIVEHEGRSGQRLDAIERRLGMVEGEDAEAVKNTRAIMGMLGSPGDLSTGAPSTGMRGQMAMLVEHEHQRMRDRARRTELAVGALKYGGAVVALVAAAIGIWRALGGQ